MKLIKTIAATTALGAFTLTSNAAIISVSAGTAIGDYASANWTAGAAAGDTASGTFSEAGYNLAATSVTVTDAGTKDTDETFDLITPNQTISSINMNYRQNTGGLGLTSADIQFGTAVDHFLWFAGSSGSDPSGELNGSGITAPGFAFEELGSNNVTLVGSNQLTQSGNQGHGWYKVTKSGGGTFTTFTYDYDNSASTADYAHSTVLVAATPIPEPSSSVLLGLGGLALILRRRK